MLGRRLAPQHFNEFREIRRTLRRILGKETRQNVEFGGLLGHAPIMKVSKFSCEKMIARKGRIPAPIHSFKN